MPPVTNLRRTRPIIWVPGSTDIKYKVTATQHNGNVVTLMNTYTGSSDSNFMVEAPTITREATNSLGSFKISIVNDEGRFLNAFTGGEVVEVFADITDATTRIFRGKVDNVFYGFNESNGYFIDLEGRDYPEFVDKTITGQKLGATADVALAGILNSDFSDVTLVFWNGSVWAEATYNSTDDTVTWNTTVSTFPSTTSVNISYQNKKAWTTITEVCTRVGLDCYLEYDGTKWTLRTFVKESITNSNAGIAYGINLISMSEYGIDNTEIVNRVTVYGKLESENILLLKTVNDTTSQTKFWIKDKLVNDSSIDSMTEIGEKASSELSSGLLTFPSGRMVGAGLYTIRPGDMIVCQVQYAGILGAHKVQKFTHTLGDMFTTNVEFTKKISGVKDLFVPKIDPNSLDVLTPNLNGMKDSFTVYFDGNGFVTHNNTAEVSGKLRLQDNKTSGTATSIVKALDYNATQCEFRRYENFNTDLDSYEVSNNGGGSWEAYSTAAGAVHTFQTPNSRLRFRMNLVRSTSSATSPAYESVCLIVR